MDHLYDFILADDVFIRAIGQLMLTILARAINFTHRYLQTMGTTIAPDKSYNFASTPPADKWLRETWWNEIGTSSKFSGTSDI